MDEKTYPQKNVVLTEEMVKYLDTRARQERRSVSSMMRIILDAEMLRHPLSEKEQVKP